MSTYREPRWYAFVTRPRHEKKVKATLDQKGVEAYLPLRRTLNQWKDRKKWVETPLFSCYVFARIAYVDRYDVLTVPSVVRIVTFNNEPAPVRDEEIESLKILEASDIDLNVVDGLLPGDAIRIKSGPLCGLEGYLTDFQGKRWLVIQIAALGKSVMVDARENVVEKITSNQKS